MYYHWHYGCSLWVEVGTVLGKPFGTSCQHNTMKASSSISKHLCDCGSTLWVWQGDSCMWARFEEEALTLCVIHYLPSMLRHPSLPVLCPRHRHNSSEVRLLGYEKTKINLGHISERKRLQTWDYSNDGDLQEFSLEGMFILYNFLLPLMMAG